MTKTEIINAYVIAHEKQLKAICSKLYKGNDKHKDLFQEFYLKMLECDDDWFNRYSIKQACYWKIVECYKKRHRKRYGSLEDVFYTEDIEGLKLTDDTNPEQDYFDKIGVNETELTGIIKTELRCSTGFLPMYILMESLNKRPRELVERTGINSLKQFRLRKQAKAIILNQINAL